MKGQPFFFDENHFDEDGSLKMREDDPALELKYTDDDLEIAKNTAYAKGKKEGLAESKESLEAQALKTLEHVLGHAATLLQAEEERNKRYEAEAIHLTTHIVKKIFPVMFDKYGLAELERLISKTLESCPKNNNIELTVHTDIKPLVEDYLQKTNADSEGKIKIIVSDDMNQTESRLSWADGGAILAPEKIAGQILEVLTETLAAENIIVEDVQKNESDTLTPQNAEQAGEENE